MSIPKVIHYCWFGKNEKSELIKRCISSWKKVCPDWEIKEWNEENFPVDFCPYAERAYREKRYGFLADAARLKIIYENGGIYLDTDVELRKRPDEFMEFDAWFAYGQETEINTGSGFGAIKGHWLVKALLDQYESFDVNQPYQVCTKVDTRVFREKYPDYAGDHRVRQVYDRILITNNIWNYATHHYTGSWMTPWQRMTTHMAGILPNGLRTKLIEARRKLKKAN